MLSLLHVCINFQPVECVLMVYRIYLKRKIWGKLYESDRALQHLMKMSSVCLTVICGQLSFEPDEFLREKTERDGH